MFKSQKVLIVDDTPENIQVLMQTLRDEYAIIAATNGDKALQLASKTPRPDIILLDVMMPGIDGYEVCRRLKTNPLTSGIPVIFVTALSEEQDEATGLSLGAVDYIAKPFRPALVKARVHNQLELKRHRDHLEDMVHERTRELALVKEVTVECLANLTETRDPETGGHIKRTQNYIRALAEHLAGMPGYADTLDYETINLLYLSAPLHDIGKVGVPDSILLKPGKLKPEEFEEMKKHTIYGRDALKVAEDKLGGNSFLHYAKEIAYGHHEHWNGNGYPLGLSGTDIPLSARLMALADVYDALISRRIYKPSFPHSRAIAIIQKGRATHFDPDICDAFMELSEVFRRIALEYADYDEERRTLKE